MSESEEEDLECPLCLEEFDLSDRKFKPCECGYQICRFCWNHIKQEQNGTCPACRRPYGDQPVEFEAVDPAEVARMQKEKKQKDRERREMENANRRHLANMRVMQKNLVYVVGLPPKLAHEETLRQHEYFGQYGRIAKVVISRRAAGGGPEPGVYITFVRKEDASRCIQAVEGTIYEGRVLKATYGTTKYCTYYLRGLNCQNSSCMYLHEPGEDADSYTREEMASGKHQEEGVNPSSLAMGKAPLGRSDGVGLGSDEFNASSALPATAGWAKTVTRPTTKPKISDVMCRLEVFRDIFPMDVPPIPSKQPKILLIRGFSVPLSILGLLSNKNDVPYLTEATRIPGSRPREPDLS